MTLLTIFVGVIAFANLLLLGGLAYLAIAVKRLLDKSIKPAVTEATSAIKTVNELVEKVEEKTERILNIGEETAREVSDKVVATTNVLQKSVTPPLINVSSILAGVSKALSVLRRAST